MTLAQGASEVESPRFSHAAAAAAGLANQCAQEAEGLVHSICARDATADHIEEGGISPRSLDALTIFRSARDASHDVAVAVATLPDFGKTISG